MRTGRHASRTRVPEQSVPKPPATATSADHDIVPRLAAAAAQGHSLTPSTILALQRTAGNRAVGRLLERIPSPQCVSLQREIKVGEDFYNLNDPTEAFEKLKTIHEAAAITEQLKASEDLATVIKDQFSGWNEDGATFSDWPELISKLRYLIVAGEVYGNRDVPTRALLRTNTKFLRMGSALSGRIEVWLKEHRTFTDWQEAALDVEKAATPKEGEKDKPEVVTIGNQTYTLVGTMHGASGADRSAIVPSEHKQNADLIVEYPPLPADRQSYNEKDIAGVNDSTQAALVGETLEKGSSMKAIGAEGRKAYGEKEKLHSISLRHKQPSEFSLPADLIKPSHIRAIVAAYIMRCRGEEQDGASDALTILPELVTYKDGTDLAKVLTSTADKVKALSKVVGPEKMAMIGNQVLATLDQGIEGITSEYEGLRQTKPDEALERHNSEIVTHAYDAVCDLLLFTQTLASDKAHVVVAFGADHLKSLSALLQAIREKSSKEEIKD